MPELTPLDDNRQEHFLNGEDLEPITRREHFYAGRENELPEGHQEPETREEWFIKKYREAGDVTVEEITITENGTTTAPSGKAYSPIHTNVPQPTLTTLDVTENGTYTAPSGTAYNKVDVDVEGYKITDVSGLPSPIATFTDGSALPMPKLEVGIEPVQEGSGDPSPENIRPISGWSAVDVTVADDVDNPTTTETITIQLGDTYYGGKLDVVNGVLTLDEVNVFFKDLTFMRQARGSAVGGYYFRADIDDNAISDTDATQLYSHGVSNNPYASKENCARAFESSAYLFVGFSDDMNITTLADFNTWVSNNQNASICYKIKTPIEIQLTPTAVKSLEGTNNLSANTGDVVEASYWESL